MRERKKKSDSVLKVIPIGGLSEIGKNMTLFEQDNEILIVDCGMTFPEDDQLGIDIVIPDFTYVRENKDKIKGLVLTHGHEDHIGGIPYLLKEVDVPIYGTRLTLGLVENRLKEQGIKGKMNIIRAGDKWNVGKFSIEAIRATHSIADAVALSIDTKLGTVFHTGDFKIDYTPIDGEPIDLQRIAEIGKKGVLLLLADSTNAEKPGFTKSETAVGEILENIFKDYNRRIIVGTFSSNVHRVQKIIDAAVKNKRKVALSGRSMVNVVKLAVELGYLNIPEGTLIDINRSKDYKDNQLVIITTGSQGEPMSALSRMAGKDHKAVQIKEGDVVVLSSTPVPGNETAVSNVVNKLFELGATVIYSDIADIHVSGHASVEELKLIHSLIKPKYFIPVHGEYRHLYRHKDLALKMGMNKENVFLLELGDCLVIGKNKAEHLKGVIPADDILVDGLGVGDVGNVVLKDRKMLSEAGLIIVAASIERETGRLVSGPEILTRGFVYVKESEDIIREAEGIAYEVLTETEKTCPKDWNERKNLVRSAMRNFIYARTKRSPMILTIFLEV
ncbi:MAG: ribonuclease J [Anaerovoracaceae bacterium]|nr:ribonuclease J [Clostridiales bacterium]